jgi:hypothetical protein
MASAYEVRETVGDGAAMMLNDDMMQSRRECWEGIRSAAAVAHAFLRTKLSEGIEGPSVLIELAPGDATLYRILVAHIGGRFYVGVTNFDADRGNGIYPYGSLVHVNYFMEKSGMKSEASARVVCDFINNLLSLFATREIL